MGIDIGLNSYINCERIKHDLMNRVIFDNSIIYFRNLYDYGFYAVNFITK